MFATFKLNTLLQTCLSTRRKLQQMVRAGWWCFNTHDKQFQVYTWIAIFRVILIIVYICGSYTSRYNQLTIGVGYCSYLSCISLYNQLPVGLDYCSYLNYITLSTQWTTGVDYCSFGATPPFLHPLYLLILTL